MAAEDAERVEESSLSASRVLSLQAMRELAASGAPDWTAAAGDEVDGQKCAQPLVGDR